MTIKDWISLVLYGNYHDDGRHRFSSNYSRQKENRQTCKASQASRKAAVRKWTKAQSTLSLIIIIG